MSAGGREPPEGYPRFRSHLRPRTRAGWVALVAFILLFLLAEPPLLYLVANRIEPWLFGLPFLYAYLALVYASLVMLLLWIQRRRL